jgi:hypothetical protein
MKAASPETLHTEEPGIDVLGAVVSVQRRAAVQVR